MSFPAESAASGSALHRLQAAKLNADHSGAAVRDEVIEVLRERIIAGELKPGERVRERALSQEFGVSRIPVREAILVLEQQHLLRTEPRIGATVTRMTAQLVAELFDVRLALEPLTASLAARNRTAGDLVELDEAHAQSLAAGRTRDSKVGSLANADFHLAMLNAAHSEMLWQTAGPLHPHIQRMFRRTIVAHEAALCADHQEILNAIRSQDEDLASFWARRHVQCTRDRSIAAFE